MLELDQINTSNNLHNPVRSFAVYLEQLHHGQANISINVTILHELLLQADWLPQIHIGLAEQVKQLHCFFIVRRPALQ